MSKTIWVVEVGEYSDYRVSGVFTTKENAELIAAKVGDGATVAEWDLDPGVEAIHKRWKRFNVLMQHDGEVERVHELEHYSAEDNCWIWRRTLAPAYRSTPTTDVLNATMWARHEKHAVKIANEKRLQMIAAGEW